MEQVKFKGAPLYLNGRDYLIPALSLRQTKESHELLSKVIEIDPKDPEAVQELMDQYVPVIGQAFRRNYEEVTDENLFDWLDLSNFVEAVRIVQAASGYTRVATLGEAQPAAISGEPSSGS